MFRWIATLLLALSIAATPALAQDNGNHQGGGNNGNGGGNGGNGGGGNGGGGNGGGGHTLPPKCRDNPNGEQNNADCDFIALSVVTNINFGRLVVVGDGVGQVVIDVDNGGKIVSGGLGDIGGWAVRGTATVTGRAFEPVVIAFPASVLMTDASGASGELRDFQTDLPGGAVLDGDGRLEFAFTGTLYTDASVVAGGKLRGRVPITVSYF